MCRIVDRLRTDNSSSKIGINELLDGLAHADRFDPIYRQTRGKLTDVLRRQNEFLCDRLADKGGEPALSYGIEKPNRWLAELVIEATAEHRCVEIDA